MARRPVLIAESFTGAYARRGAGPLIATWLFGTYGTPHAIAVILVCAVLSLAATAMMKDYTGMTSARNMNSESLSPAAFN